MATFCVNGRSLSRLSRAANRKAAWLAKLARNVAPKLNRIGDLVTMTPACLNPRKDNRLVLVYTGPGNTIGEIAKHFTRIQKVLGATFGPDNTAVVKFGRITATVEIRYDLEQKKAA